MVALLNELYNAVYTSLVSTRLPDCSPYRSVISFINVPIAANHTHYSISQRQTAQLIIFSYTHITQVSISVSVSISIYLLTNILYIYNLETIYIYTAHHCPSPSSTLFSGPARPFYKCHNLYSHIRPSIDTCNLTSDELGNKSREGIGGWLGID